MSGFAYRFVSGAKTGLDGGAHVNPRRRITRRPKALWGSGVPKPVRQKKFRQPHPTKTFQRLESDYRRRRHCVDADSRWATVCGESRERIFRCRAWHELKVEPDTVKTI